MSETINDRVTELLTETETAVDSIPSDETGDGFEAALEDTNLFETASEANDLLENENATDLLEAFGLDELPDGSEPQTIPEAIAKGSADDVEDLRVLLKVAKLSGQEDDEDRTREALEGIRRVIADRDGDGVSEESLNGSDGGDQDGESSETGDGDGEDDGDEESEADDTDGEDAEDSESSITETVAAGEINTRISPQPVRPSSVSTRTTMRSTSSTAPWLVTYGAIPPSSLSMTPIFTGYAVTSVICTVYH